MRLTDFSFELPKELIAQKPAEPRDSSRLLVYNRADRSITHSHVRDIGTFLPPRALLVANNSKVRRGRLFAKADEKDIEVLVLEQSDTSTYRCMIGGKGLKVGTTLAFFSEEARIAPAPLGATVVGIDPDPSMTTFRLEFTADMPLEEAFETYGHTPLPPYIEEGQSRPDQYQTVFAQPLGSAAAPTAGLHFTPELIESLKAQGIGWSEVTLHVGIGTFLPLRKEEIEENHLHFEQTLVSDAAAATIIEARAEGRKIVAVGTTSTRTLESHGASGSIRPGSMSTDLFIYPGYAFKAVDCLMTNFHLPHSSLLLLVSAFLGNHPEGPASEREMTLELQRIYAEAIKERYRFFSFGDSMLVL